MRKFKQNKLWRDKLIEKLELQGSRIVWRHLSDEEFQKRLQEKLLEEAEEVVQATNRQELISELADLWEVIETLAHHNAISMEDISACKETKLKERGCAVVGVDASREMVDAARALGLDARVMDGQALGFNQEFDAVFSNPSSKNA